MPHRLTVVVSQSRSQNPKKRALEEEIVAGLLGQPGVDVAVISDLYDLKPEDTDMLCLSGVAGNLVVCSWLYPRAARWTLHRNAVCGREGVSLLPSLGEDDGEDASEQETSAEGPDTAPRVIDQQTLPARRIYCLDLRVQDQGTVYVEEIQRIAAELNTTTIELTNGQSSPSLPQPASVKEVPARRWYPVIDPSRCTNCLECIDFCLFGVYGIDAQETILVEQPDNCRQGCPACSRVCPENAIIFPQHKSPSIAGSPEIGGPLKIDLSQLFGAPSPGAEKSLEVASRERDEQLLLAGREAVGITVGIAQRQPSEPAQPPQDDLDRLIDSLDALDI